jgi:Domain of unknown function (DUF4160)
MPTVLRELGFRFFFYSNENNEPAHIHIEKGDATAKIWLQPIDVENNYGFSNREMNQILKIITENQLNFIQFWHDYFN